MYELKKENNIIKKPFKNTDIKAKNNIKKEIEQNYEMGIEYFMNLEEYEQLKDSE